MSGYEIQPQLPFKYTEADLKTTIREIILNSLLVLFAFYAIFLQLTQDGVGMMFFFTFWNNVTMMLFPYLKRTKLARIPVVFVLFPLSIYPIVELSTYLTTGLDYVWFEPRNILGHYVCPILVLAIYHIERLELPRESLTDFSILVAYYFSVIFNIFVLKWKLPLSDDYYPYFFMEHEVYPVWITVIIALALLLYFKALSRLVDFSVSKIRR